jgi:hypothetical protein
MGLCGAVLVDESRKVSSVLGIHVGGDEKTRLSVACCVLRQDLEASVQHFINGLLIQSGLDFEKLPNYTPNIYRHNPFLDTTDRLDGVELLGSAIQRYSFNDKVVYTPICDDVKIEFKVDYSFVAPPFKFGGDKRHGVRQLIRDKRLPLRCETDKGFLAEIQNWFYRFPDLHIKKGRSTDSRIHLL